LDKLKQNKSAIVIVVVIAVAALAMIGINNKSKAIDEVHKLLREYKTAKALLILKSLKGNSQTKDSELDTLIFYTLVKSKNFNPALTVLKQIDYIPKKFSDDFAEIVEILNINNRNELLALLLPKAYKLKLDEEFFIDLASNINSLSPEMQVLESGLSYSRHSNSKADFDKTKLQEYIVKRYLDISEMQLGSNKADNALKTLKRLENLGLIDNSSRKGDYYLTLALVYKALEQHDLAWDNIQLSAKLDNDRAKSMINTLASKYKKEY
jgi:hypothetical protein